MLKKIKLISILLSGLIFMGLFMHLGKDNVNVDQFLWYERTASFEKAIKEKDYAKTYQQYHPGVLHMYLILLGQKTYNLFFPAVASYKTVPYYLFDEYNFSTKVYEVLINILVIFCSANLLRKLTDNKGLIVLFLLFTFTETYFLGIIRNLHLDALTANLSFLYILSFWLGITKNKRSYLVFSGFVAGLGLLTKSIFGIEILVSGLTAIVLLMARKVTFKAILNFGLMTGILTALTFILFFPAMWVTPKLTLHRIWDQGLYDTALNGKDNFKHTVNNIVTIDPGPLFYFRTLLYRTSPALQVAFLSALFFLITKRKCQKTEKNYQGFVLLSIINAVLLIVIFTFLTKKTDRYLAMVFPFLILFAADAFTKIRHKKIIYFVFLFNIALNFFIHPYYFAFYTPIWGGVKKAMTVIYINQGGIGSYEIAQYLNNREIPLEVKIGATNKEELRAFSRYQIRYLDPSKRKEYKIVVLPLQKDQLFKSGKGIVKEIKIYGQTYIRVYEK